MATYLLRVLTRFEAAHHLVSYRGAPEPAHGHSWRVEVGLASDEVNDEGFVYDFVEIQRELGDLARRFHHRDLNTVPPFDTVSPTTEALARWFFHEMQERLPQAQVREVTVWEGPDCSVTYQSSVLRESK